MVGDALVTEPGLEARDRVPQLPHLDLGREAVLRRVIGRRVCRHPIRVGLDQARPLPGPGAVEHLLGHGIRRQDVVAIDPHPGEAEAVGPLVDRRAHLPLIGFGDGPLVVLAEEDDRGVVDTGEDEALVDIALRGRAITHEGDDGRVSVGVTGADIAVALHTHGISGAEHHLVADDDRVGVETELLGIPRAPVDPAIHGDQPHRVQAAAPGDAVLAIAREGMVLGPQRPPAADLRGLLPEERDPQAEFTLPLQGRRLEVEASDQDQVTIEAAQVLVGEGVDVVGILLRAAVKDSLPLGVQQLDHVRATVEGAARAAPQGGLVMVDPAGQLAAGHVCDNVVAHGTPRTSAGARG